MSQVVKLSKALQGCDNMKEKKSLLTFGFRTVVKRANYEMVSKYETPHFWPKEKFKCGVYNVNCSNT